MSETYVAHDEFKRLEGRVTTVEQEADGERLLSRYILTQSRQNGDDLAILKSRVDRLEKKVDRVETELMSLKTDLVSLKKDLPAIVADAMREVLREHGA
jgi:tetrahydromethanopterin S-methyltransferase subunit G